MHMNSPIIEKTNQDTPTAFNRLYEIIKRLRSPEGCPWDREQTPLSMRGNLLEEVFECIDAIDENDDEHMKEELGDVFLLASMISFMKEEAHSFSVADVLHAISDKLIRRHPHVFQNESLASTPDEVVELWNKVKKSEKGSKDNTGVLGSVPRHFPPMEYAHKMQKKAAKVGFDFPHISEAVGKLREELEEMEAALQTGLREEIDEEIGDLIFSVVNVARLAGADPSLVLHQTNKKFKRRFEYMEARMNESGKSLEPAHADLMNVFWEEAKTKERKD